jgi:hypothetical protein
VRQRAGFVDGAAVVVERRLQAGRIGRGKEAAAAVARQRDAGVAQLPLHRRQPHRGHLVAPGCDGTDAAPRAFIDDV